MRERMSDSAEKLLAVRQSPHHQRVQQLLQTVRDNAPERLPNLPSKPTIPDHTILKKQCAMIFEETMELLEACGCELIYLNRNQGLATPAKVKEGDLVLVVSSDAAPDLPHIAKEAADVSVTTQGLLVECGISDVAVLEEVDWNNLGKFGPGGYLDENKKWRKPPNYPTPDIAQVLRDQGWESDEVKHEQTDAENVPVPSGSDRQI